jgi:hypothetical protein
LSLIPTRALHLFPRRCPSNVSSDPLGRRAAGPLADSAAQRHRNHAESSDDDSASSTAGRRPLWRSRAVLWRRPPRDVDDSPELEVSERNVAPALVGPGPEPLELLSRTSSGECGIGRRRRSVPPPNGLPGGGGGGPVTRPSGSQEPTGSTGSVTSTGRHGGSPDHGLVPGKDGSPTEGPLSLIPTGALHHVRTDPADVPATQLAAGDLLVPFCRVGVVRRGSSAGSAFTHWSRPLLNRSGRFLWTATELLWTRAGQAVDDPEETAVRRNRTPEPLVGLGFRPVELLPRTSSGECGIGRRRRSAPPPNGLPGGGGGGRVTRLPGS